MISTRFFFRATASTLLCFSIALSGGCGWLRGKSGYENSPESRPLEVPPDLDLPASDPSMQIPVATGGSERVATNTISATSASFVLQDAIENAWRRVGLALERIDGVAVTERAQLLSVFNVSYEGEEFLIKLATEGEVTRVSAVSKEGRELTTGAAGRLLGLLKSRLG